MSDQNHIWLVLAKKRKKEKKNVATETEQTVKTCTHVVNYYERQHATELMI